MEWMEVLIMNTVSYLGMSKSKNISRSRGKLEQLLSLTFLSCLYAFFLSNIQGCAFSGVVAIVPNDRHPRSYSDLSGKHQSITYNIHYHRL